MKTRSAVIAGCLVVAGCAFSPAVFGDDEVREWRSTTGTVIRGELIEVKDGKAIIRPETKLIVAPLLKLREADREYAVAWGKRQEKLVADRAEADLMLAKTKPLGKALIGRTVKLNGKSLESCEIENISKLQYVLVYLTRESVTGDVDNLNRLYKRLSNRYDNFEFIAMTSTKTNAEHDALVIDTGIQFPTVRPSMLRAEGTQPLTQMWSRPVLPQIIIIDATGQIVSDSYRAADPNAKKKYAKEGEWQGPRQDLKQPIEDLQKLLRVASKEEGAPGKGEAE